MRRTLIETEGVKSAEGRYYSPGLRAGDWMVLSGQVPLGEDGKTVSTDAATQWRQCLDNIKTLLESAGASMDDVVMCNVFVTDMRHYLNHQEIRREYFSEPYPISTAIGGISLAREEWLIEIEAWAHVGD